MNTRVFKKSTSDILRSGLFYIVFTIAVVFMAVVGLRQAEVAGRAEGLRILEEGILRAVVKNYAIHGSFPENIRQVEENFGIHIDRTRFLVHYNIIAPNIMPHIVVIELDGGRR